MIDRTPRMTAAEYRAAIRFTVPGKPLVNVDLREAARLLADGYCFGCIARKLGATTAHIRYLLREREA